MIVPTAVQVPTLPETAHERQLPQGPLEQQTPSVQNELRHSVFEAHEAASGLRCVQEPIWQVSPPMQSPSLAHIVRQAPAPQT
jgi:hypothetical protein